MTLERSFRFRSQKVSEVVHRGLLEPLGGMHVKLQAKTE